MAAATRARSRWKAACRPGPPSPCIALVRFSLMWSPTRAYFRPVIPTSTSPLHREMSPRRLAIRPSASAAPDMPPSAGRSSSAPSCLSRSYSSGLHLSIAASWGASCSLISCDRQRSIIRWMTTIAGASRISPTTRERPAVLAATGRQWTNTYSRLSNASRLRGMSRVLQQSDSCCFKALHSGTESSETSDGVSPRTRSWLYRFIL